MANQCCTLKKSHEPAVDALCDAGKGEKASKGRQEETN